ncbi:MAG: hypothetical protein K0S65_5752, partial [Labilithrix sp.]|nr:hypothetical protein [Labilithrix sp.]
MLGAASCSSAREQGGEPVVPDASSEVSDGLEGDAGLTDSAPNAPPFDGGLLAVECEQPSCAIELVSSESESFCALLADGTVACWGANDVGQLGRGEASVGSATPARVTGLSDVVALDHTCAVDRAGAAWCWGKGAHLLNEWGYSTDLVPVKLDIPPARKVSARDRTGCALIAEGVLCWGSNVSGQVAKDAPFVSEPALLARAISVRPGSPIGDLAVNEAAFILREDNTTESWGANVLLARESSFFPDPYPLPTDLGRVTALDTVEKRVCAAVDGAAYCWGDDLGVTPQVTVTPEPIVQIATTRTIRGDGSRIVKNPRWCAAAASGAVFCSGDNAAGQAGDGTNSYAYWPVTVAGLPGRAARVRTTHDTTCVLQTNGEVYCFGNSYYGQLGNGL